MKLLLDTHVFLWSLLDTAKLSATAGAALVSPENEVIVSAVNFWEISLKFALRRLDLQGILPAQLPAEASLAGYTLVPLEGKTAASFHQLPLGLHRDPFDRMLAWQAIRAGWTLVSRDRWMDSYVEHGLQLLW